MNTLVNIPAPLLREAKAKASKAGISVKTLFIHALEREIKKLPAKNGARKPVRVPLIRSKKPGWLKLTNEQINEILG